MKAIIWKEKLEKDISWKYSSIRVGVDILIPEIYISEQRKLVKK